jgi:uroporphyrinogen decarboxylase
MEVSNKRFMRSVCPMVTSYERVMDAIKLKEPDIVPVVPQVTYTTARITGVKFVEAMKDPEIMARALLVGYREILYDGIYVGWESSFDLMAETMGCTLRMPEDDLPSVSEHVVKNKSDIDKVSLPDPERDGRLPIHLKAIDLVKNSVGNKVPIFRYIPGPFTLATLLRGTYDALLELRTDKAFIHKLIRLATDASKLFGIAAVNHGADIVVVADPTASSSVISPQMFREFSLPYTKEVLSVVKKAGAVPSLHICGKTEPILGDMVKTGAEVLEVDHLVDLAKAKSAVGKHVCLEGNIEPAGILLKGKPSRVLRSAKDCIKKAAADGGFILSSGCEVPLDTPIENLKAMVKAARTYGMY